MIKAEKIVKSYPALSGARTILNSVDLFVGAGEICAITGPSGAGKSTLLNIVGLLDRPDSGSVFINGSDALALGENQRREYRNKKLGFVFQHHFLVPELSVWQNISYPGAVLEGGFAAGLRERALELLDFLKLTHLADSYPSSLSGGESQRVAVARAVFNAPDLLIMDEPSGSLDFESKNDVIRLILSLNRALKITILIATHDESVKNACSKNLILSRTASVTREPASFRERK